MQENYTLTKTRMTVGDNTVDLHMNLSDASRPAVLLIHGIGVSGRYFIPFARELVKDYRVIAVDLPGYGKTPKPRRALDIKELAAVVVQLSRQLQLHQPIIVGQSMGCQIAARAVAMEPTLFHKMLLLGPTVNKAERSLIKQAVRLGQDTLHEPLAVNWMIFVDYLRMGFLRYLRTCRYMLRDHIEEVLPQCTIPVLIVRGQEDKIVPRKWVAYLQAVTPDATIQELPDAPHAAQFMMPVHLAAIFRQFTKP